MRKKRALDVFDDDFCILYLQKCSFTYVHFSAIMLNRVNCHFYQIYIVALLNGQPPSFQSPEGSRL